MDASFEALTETMQGWWDSFIGMLPNIALALIVLVISILVVRRLRSWSRVMLRKTSASKNVTDVLSNLGAAAFMVVVLFIILNILNLSDAVTALLGTAGVAGLVLGLALQSPLSNLFSGLLISVRDYYRIGDLVETNGYFGIIKKINLRSTILSTNDGQEVVIPNRDVLQEPLKNYSHNALRRIELSCGVSYTDDLEKVKTVAVESIENSDIERDEDRPVEVYFTEFGDSSINFILRFWKRITSQGEYMKARDSAIIALKKHFDQNDITIPFPIRTIEFSLDTTPAHIVTRSLHMENAGEN